MTNYTRREHVITTVEYRVPAVEPWRATWTDVNVAISAALAEYKEITGIVRPSDDSIRVRLEDDDIVISFVKKEDDHA